MKGIFRKAKVTADKAVIAAGTAVGTLLAKVPVFAEETDPLTSSNYSKMNGDTIVNGVIDFFSKIGFWGGLLYAAAATYTLILAIRNEDNEGRNKAILNLVAAIALIATGTILGLVFVNDSSKP